MQTSSVAKHVFLAALVVALGANVTLAQQDNVAAIRDLLDRVSKGGTAPASALDPLLGDEARKADSKRFAAEGYELRIQPTGAPSLSDENHATAPVEVHWDDHRGNSVDVSDSTAHLVRRDGVWYFASYDFLAWPGYLVALLVLGCSVGVGYAAVVLVLYRKIVVSSDAASIALVWIPFYWPSLFRKFRGAGARAELP